MAEFGAGCTRGTVRVVAVDQFGNQTNLGCHSIPSNYENQVDNSSKYPVLRGDAADIMPMLYGPLEEGEYYETGDINGDGLNEVYKATTLDNETEQILIVYGFDNEGNKTETSYDDWLGQYGQTEDPALGELISTYGQEAVDDAQRKLEELEKILGQTIDDPLGTLEGIIQKTKSASSGSNCGFQSVPGGTGIEEWVLDCATVGVGLPVPFPIPGPLGSIFKGATVREIKDAIENAGYEIGKVLRGETPIDEVFDKIVDGVVTKVKDIFKDADEVSINDILGTIGDILVGGGYILAGDLYDEYFKDKVNSVIPNVPIIPFDSSQECRDSERYTLNAEGQCGACIDPNKIYDPSQDKCVPKDEDDDATIDYGMCDDGLTPKEDEDGTNCSGVEPINEVGDPCTTGDGKDGTYQDVGGELKCVSSSTDDDDDDVDDDVIVDDGIDCSSPVPVLPYVTLIDRKTAWNNKCIPQGYCPASPDETPTLALDHQDGDCKKPLITDGDGTTTVDDCPEGTQQCPEGTVSISGEKCVSNVATECVKRDPDDTVDGDDGTTTEYECKGNPQTSDEIQQCLDQGWVQCPNDGSLHPPGSDPEKVCADVVPPECEDPQTDQEYKDCGYVQCGYGYANAGQWFPQGTDMEEACGGKKQCDNGATNYPECNVCPQGQELINGECGVPETVCDNGATVESGCQECPSGQDFDADGNCADIYTCPDPNATVNADGSCGPCKQGYVFDGSVERCVQESVDPCDDPAYAAANPTECGTTTPLDCSDPEYAAANPDECGTTPPPPEPPSSGGGGGGGGMFRPQAVAPMGMGDPQLLARTEFPIVDYLSESLAKQTKDDLMSGMLTGNIV